MELMPALLTPREAAGEQVEAAAAVEALEAVGPEAAVEMGTVAVETAMEMVAREVPEAATEMAMAMAMATAEVPVGAATETGAAVARA